MKDWKLQGLGIFPTGAARMREGKDGGRRSRAGEGTGRKVAHCILHLCATHWGTDGKQQWVPKRLSSSARVERDR